MFEILLLSLIQGLTEFLPVSSSSHLILISNHLNFTNQSISIDVSLHIGSFIAVVTYFFNDIKNFIKNKFLFAKIIISSIPVMIVGFFLIKTNYIDILRSVKIIGWTTVIFGALLFISDKFKINKKISKDFTFKTAVFIGILQILSLVPGVSRSGITITAARFLNFNRFESAKISFLLSIPTLAAVSIFGLKEILYFNNFNFSFLNLIAIFLSFIFSFITIKFFLNYIKNFSLNVFVAYRIAVGLVILYFAYL
tara:strand:- start:144 stop:902 length:759 start_codon:yes stop_codon:yes gene_type:complete